MAEDRWNNRNEARPMERRDERGRYISDRGRYADRGPPAEGPPAYGAADYDRGDIGYGGGDYGMFSDSGARQGLAAPASFTAYGAASSGGYPVSYGAPGPDGTAWLGSNRADRGAYRDDRGRPPEQRSFGPSAGNSFVQDVADGGEGRAQHLGEHRGEHRGRGPRNYKRSDERIVEDVSDRLTDDAWLDAQDIEVSVKGQDVTLDGFVANRDAKHRAEFLAEEVSGVNHVQNNLRVRPTDEATLNGAS